MDFELEDADSLSGLEDRVLRAVNLVTSLKEENAQLKARLATAESMAQAATTAREQAESVLADFRANSGKAEKELELLLAERKQVKTRIEKLLGQMDLLSAT
ncbi:MAG: cell division protein ZapB [Acidobacteria bacterium]|nr:cell division protein ZapB [Acidobacteriota bacterium]